jgi:hypothetical protein
MMLAMATFNVFVVGAVDDSPASLPSLAQAMAQRYGLSPQDLVARLKRGRFRVKSNVDAATADRFKRDLEAIGARVLVEDAALSPTATPVAGAPAVRPSNLSLPPANQPAARQTPATGLAAAGAAYQRPSTPIPTQPAHQRPSTPIPTDMTSGLAAAFSEAPAQTDLGALSAGSLSLASLDGEEAPAASGSFDLAPEPEPVVKIVAKPKSTEPPKTRPVPSEPLDMFAPPDAGDQNFAVDLATEELEERARKKASAPPENTTSTPVSQPLQTTRRTPVSMAAVAEPAAGTKPFSRPRFAGIVVLALVIGFLPVHFVAKMREKSAFAEIDQQVAEAHAAADSHETWLALDAAREKLREEKESKRQMIALTSMLLWAVVAAGVGFALMRVPTERKKPTAA